MTAMIKIFKLSCASAVALWVMASAFCLASCSDGASQEKTVREQAEAFADRLLNIDTNCEDMDSLMFEIIDYEQGLSAEDAALFGRYMDTLYADVKKREAEELQKSLREDSLCLGLLEDE